MDIIDLRSDTLTRPTDAMRRAMAEADVGDDVFGEDPTVNRLEAEAAKLLGKEAALFVPTGTMGNQIALWVHTGRRGQALVEQDCHIALYEGGGAALLSNVMLRTIKGRAGTFDAADMGPHFPPDDPHFAPIRLVAIENTHNHAGGRTWDAKKTAEVCDVAAAHRAGTHIDGARIFNAAIAKKTTAKRLVAPADTVMFCLSKGLSAPVGSLLCGPEEFVEEARHARKVLGGGMRQAGVLAAAGLVALGEVDRLKEDHANARRLAQRLADVADLRVDVEATETNMVLADVRDTGLTGEEACDVLREVGVLALTLDAGPVVRFVTHRHITGDDIDAAADRIARVFGKAKR